MDASSLSAYSGGLALLAAAVYTERQRRRNARLAVEATERADAAAKKAADDAARVAADAGAYQRAVAIDTNTVDRLLAELKRLETQITEMRRQLDERDDEMVELRRQLQSALLTIDRMVHLLNVHGVEIPPGFTAD